ncbi:MAG: hypothetical protein RIR69_534 [Actinomycetota bacterium]|jgi:hypothetical protein
MDTRSRDLETISHIRSSRHDAVERSRAGNLSSVLDSINEYERCVYVVKLLDVHPALGKVRGRRLLSSLGVSQFDCVSDLSPETKSAILREVGERS